MAFAFGLSLLLFPVLSPFLGPNDFPLSMSLLLLATIESSMTFLLAIPTQARVPRFSLASVRKELVSHIMEEEGEDQEDEKKRRENRRESEQPHPERMKMGWNEICAARQP